MSSLAFHQVRGVSRGEKRRVSIAVDLMHDPAVLFLDKPTTGLDSFSAFQVMQKLHTLAEVHNRTVIITIHQPNHSILELIHNTLLLIQGNVIFSGHHSGLVNYFSDIGYNMPEYVSFSDLHPRCFSLLCLLARYSPCVFLLSRPYLVKSHTN